MRERASSVPGAPSRLGGPLRSGVRPAVPEDAAGVAEAVGLLLAELGGEEPGGAELEAASRELIADSEAGVVLVYEAGAEIVGVLAASWQQAIHVPGRYATIQDLWVLPAWRSRAIGHDLLDALCELADEQGVGRIEVGLPKEDFPRLDATRTFYEANGFVHLGPRMRRLLDEEE